MFSKFLSIGFAIALTFAAVVSISAQIDATTASGKPRNDELPKNIRESLEAQRIEREQKDYQELLERGDEVLKLSKFLEKSFAINNKLSSDDQKRLDRVEKLVKKIRRDLGGDDDDVDLEEMPTTLDDALKALRENSTKLVDELNKSSRHSISAVAISSSNLLLRIVKFIRTKQ